MPTIIITGIDGEARAVDAERDISLMEVIRNNGYSELMAMCGGCRSCATCHVYIDPEYFDGLEKMTTEENDLLESSSYRKATSRLSCQVRISDSLENLRVTIAPED